MRLVIDLQAAQGSSSARGIGRYSRELALAMVRSAREHEIIVTVSDAYVETAEEVATTFSSVLPRSNVRVWHPPRGAAPLLHEPQRLAFAETMRAQFLASLQPDLVHVCSVFEDDSVVTCQPSRLQRLPVVATFYDLIPLLRHTDFFGPSKLPSPFARWYYRCVQEVTACEGLLAISESSRNEAIDHLGFPADRIFNIRAGIGPQFHPTPLSADERTALLQRYGLRDSFIMFLAADTPNKNEAGLLAAYARLPSALQERHQLFIAGRRDRDKLYQTASQAGVPLENLVYAHYVEENDLRALYSACGLFVFPSLHEGFGLPLGEAMACGAPAIASNTTSLPEVIGRTDATFDPKDPDSIAACMRKVLENPAFRLELAEYGPIQAGRFTWQASATRTWDALEEIHDKRTQQGKTRVTGVLQKRPSLAFVSPLPPQTTSISEYCAELLPNLARHYDITLISEEETTERLLWGFPRLTPTEFLSQAGRFDRVVYQIGNSSVHRYQIETLLPRCPGVAVLHDVFLSGLIRASADELGHPGMLREVLLQAHGYPALQFVDEHGIEAALRQYPCTLPVLQNAVGVILHSERDASVLRQYFGDDATREVALIPTKDTEQQPFPPEAIARHYADAIEQAYSTPSGAVVAQALQPDIQRVAALPNAIPAASRGIARSFPSQWRGGGHKRLLIDISELARIDSGSGIQRVVREITRRALEAPPQGLRGEAVRIRDGQLRHTYNKPLSLLNLRGLDLPEMPLDVRVGDVLLCADVNPITTPAEFEELRRLRLNGLRIVLLVYDLLPLRHPDLFPDNTTISEDWYGKMLGIADAALCISRSVADDVIAWLDEEPTLRKRPLPIGFAHLGADFRNDFRKDESDGPSAPATLAALDNARKGSSIVMVGTIEPRKGYPQVLAAFERLWEAGENLSLIIIGKQGWKMDEFADQLRRSPELGKRLHWLHGCSDAEVRALYGASSGLIMASCNEGFGLPVVEAFQAGLPVLARDIPVFREVAGNQACYFSGNDPQVLATTLRDWAANDFMPRPRSGSEFTWDNCYHKMCRAIFEDEWYATWQPKRKEA
ncbi:glycosyltransferase family 4 protein [Burkholderia anthina]|uniref:glycosyltransferase family 4 protein n=1 Tax=Burkholderia anthina TaxID=179879 RepID=UPI0015885212|nr:glycosyltransferase family 1 protein [Burkholderia anthina]